MMFFTLWLLSIVLVVYFSDRQEQINKKLRMLEPLAPHSGWQMIPDLPNRKRTFASDTEFYEHVRKVAREYEERIK